MSLGTTKHIVARIVAAILLPFALPWAASCGDRAITTTGPGAVPRGTGPLALGRGGQGPIAGRTTGRGLPVPAGGDAAERLAGTTGYLLWQNTSTGERGFWALSSATPASGWMPLTTIATTWRIACTADFDADGDHDILWQNTATGEWGFWLLDGTSVASGWIPLTQIATDWRVVACADVNGDRRPDLMWRNAATGDIGTWTMSGTAPDGSGYRPTTTIAAEWEVAALADFSGDGKPDILWQNLGTGERGFWTLDGSTPGSGWIPLAVLPGNVRIRQAADVNGDGIPDLVLHDEATGERQVRFMAGMTFAGTAPVVVTTIANAWDVAGVLPAGAAPSLSIEVQPSETLASGGTFAAPPVVQLRDAGGMPRALAGVSVTASASGGTISGTSIVQTDAQGRASFPSVGVVGNGAYALTFTAPGYLRVTSRSFTVSLSPPAVFTRRAALRPASAGFGVDLYARITLYRSAATSWFQVSGDSTFAGAVDSVGTSATTTAGTTVERYLSYGPQPLGTLLFYRAVARNDAGVTYGNVQRIPVEYPVPPTVRVAWDSITRVATVSFVDSSPTFVQRFQLQRRNIGSDVWVNSTSVTLENRDSLYPVRSLVDYPFVDVTREWAYRVIPCHDAYYPVTCGPASAETAPILVKRLEPPSNVIAGSAGPTSLTITWEHEGVPGDGFDILVYRDGSPYTSATVGANARSFTISTLPEGSTYSARLNAFVGSPKRISPWAYSVDVAP